MQLVKTRFTLIAATIAAAIAATLATAIAATITVAIAVVFGGPASLLD